MLSSRTVKRIPELDGLRGIAILLVIGCHYEVFARQLWGIPKYGWIGVDLFFVLSGFLITSVLLSLRDKPAAFRKFYSRRVRRIIPPYVAFLVLLYIVTGALSDHALFRRGPVLRNLLFMQSFGSIRELLTSIASAKNLSLAHAHLGPAIAVLRGPVSNASGVLWSLSIEEYYYLLWAPVVLWMTKRGAARTGILVCLMALAVRWLDHAGTAAYFSIYHRIDAPVFGSLVALLLASRMEKQTVIRILKSSAICGALALVGVLISMGRFLGREIRQDHVFIVFGIPALSLLAAALVGLAASQSGSRLFFPLRSGVLRFLGKISYMLYLSHALVYLVFLHYFEPTWAVSLAALVCTLLLCALSWKYFEQPILEGGRQESRSSGLNLKVASAEAKT